MIPLYDAGGGGGPDQAGSGPCTWSAAGHVWSKSGEMCGVMTGGWILSCYHEDTFHFPPELPSTENIVAGPGPGLTP